MKPPFDDLQTYSQRRFKNTFLAEDNPGGILVSSGELRWERIEPRDTIASFSVSSHYHVTTEKRTSFNICIPGLCFNVELSTHRGQNVEVTIVV